MTQTTTKKPCGCGGGSAGDSSSGCGCGCKGANSGCGCESSQSQSFSRPQFFAGQLLTEDDLQSLVDYVTGKNRLHNRFLFGDGVVCGLTVTCAPCESGHVTVNPGYALDCCGNDIVVSCPTELDINQMARQLMAKLRKADCGDPCAGTTATAKGQATGESSTAAHRYCLYIDYCEQKSDPVAPYSSSSACGQAICEPTRIQENFRFELRCPADAQPGATIADRVRCCIGDSRAAEQATLDAEFLRPYLSGLKLAIAAVRDEPVPHLGADFWQHLADRVKTLESSSKKIAKLKPKDADDAKMNSALEETLDLASDLARVLLNPESDRRGHGETLDHASELLLSVSKSLHKEPMDGAIHSHLARVRTDALIELAGGLSEHLGPTTAGAAPDPAIWNAYEYRLLAHRAVFNRTMVTAVRDAYASMRDYLAGRLEQLPGGTNCTLLCTIEGLNLSTLKPVEVNAAAANSAVSIGDVLAPAVPEVIRSCFCNALIPPCAPCDDPGVLLACLTVKDCKVVEICNLDRKFVITGPNIRYWFPEIARLGEVLEEWCCPSCRRGEKESTGDRMASPPSRPLEESLSASFGRAPDYARLAISAVLEPPASRRGPLEFLAPLISSWRAGEEADLHRAIRPQNGSHELAKQLETALAEIKTLKLHQARLGDRIAKIEKPDKPGSQV